MDEEDWVVESEDYVYLRYITPFHLAAWCGYFEFFTFIKKSYPAVWNDYICSRDILGNLPLHVCFAVCDYWKQPIVLPARVSYL